MDFCNQCASLMSNILKFASFFHLTFLNSFMSDSILLGKNCFIWFSSHIFVQMCVLCSQKLVFKEPLLQN